MKTTKATDTEKFTSKFYAEGIRGIIGDLEAADQEKVLQFLYIFAARIADNHKVR